MSSSFSPAADPIADPATLRLATTLALSRATLLPPCRCVAVVACSCGSRALRDLADDLSTMAAKAERPDGASGEAPPRLRIERAVRRHLEVALDAALMPERLRDA